MRAHQLRLGMGLLGLVAAMLLGSGVAAAHTIRGISYPTVSTTPTTDPCTSSSVCSTSATVPQVGGGSASRWLSFSGGDVALLTVLGLAAIGSGTAIVLIARRRRSTPGA